MKKLIVGNWKMHPDTVEEAKRIALRTRTLASKLKHTEIVVCPPSVFIPSVRPRNKATNFHMGAQTVSDEREGAHTGEVSMAMLRDEGVEYIIVGHSEQRKKGESDAVVARKMKNTLDIGIVAILCVGEKIRDEGGAYLEILKQQIKNSLEGVPKSRAKNIILAYEPVWAIGGKEAMVPEQIYEMSLFVKKVFADVFGSEAGLKLRVLYGGSVNPLNAADIIGIGKVDGLLVGRESINMIGFEELIKAVDNGYPS